MTGEVFGAPRKIGQEVAFLKLSPRVSGSLNNQHWLLVASFSDTRGFFFVVLLQCAHELQVLPDAAQRLRGLPPCLGRLTIRQWRTVTSAAGSTRPARNALYRPSLIHLGCSGKTPSSPSETRPFAAGTRMAGYLQAQKFIHFIGLLHLIHRITAHIVLTKVSQPCNFFFVLVHHRAGKSCSLAVATAGVAAATKQAWR